MAEFIRHPEEQQNFASYMRYAIPLSDDLANKPLAERTIFFDEDLAESIETSVRQLRLIQEKGGAFAYKVRREQGGYKRVWPWAEAIRAAAVLIISQRTNFNVERACKIISAVDTLTKQSEEYNPSRVFKPFAELDGYVVTPGIRGMLKHNKTFRICISDDQYVFIEQNVNSIFFCDKQLPLGQFDKDGDLRVLTMEERRSILGFADGPLDSRGESEFFHARSSYQTLISIDLCKIAYELARKVFKDE